MSLVNSLPVSPTHNHGGGANVGWWGKKERCLSADHESPNLSQMELAPQQRSRNRAA